ncbi:MAG: nucleoside monophosphate kinase [Bryobacteraceae bacterium]
MILLLFGPPGCGKGTQARLLSNWLHVAAVSTGDLLRAEAEADTDFGRNLAQLLAAGQYASDEMVNQIVANKLDRLENGGIILDGYPRTVAQAVYLDQALSARSLPSAVAVHLMVPQDVIVQRLSSRSQCSYCNRVFNTKDHPAPYCAECGGPLIRRADDTPEVVLQRLATYHAKTGPVLAHYSGSRFLEINGDRDPEEVFKEILRLVDPAPNNAANRAGG